MSEERGYGLKPEERTESQQQKRDELHKYATVPEMTDEQLEKYRKKYGWGLPPDQLTDEQRQARDKYNQDRRKFYTSVFLSLMSDGERQEYYAAHPGCYQLVKDASPELLKRYKWRGRLADIRKLERNAYLNSPAYRYLRWVAKTYGVDRCIDALLEMVDARPSELLKGSSTEATALKEMVRIVASGRFQFIAGDLEGQGANAWDWGVSFIDENDDIYPLSDQSNGHLPKSVATGYKGPYSHTRPSLISTNFYDMLIDMFIITDIADEDNVMCFHYGGRERELLKALGVPDHLFIDALKIIRHILGAKLNGVFKDHVPYGDQLRTA